MTRPKVFLTRLIPEEGLSLLEDVVDPDIWPEDLPPEPAVLRERVRGVDGLLCLLTDTIDADLIEAAGGGLRVISQMAVGYDNIDVAEATSRGIPVGNTPGVLTEATADFAWSLLLAAARRVVEADAYVRAGRWKTWSPKVLLGADVSGGTLGIVGFGRIGQAVARRARGFEMRILYYDRQRNPDLERTPNIEFAPLDALLAAADFVSIHTAYTESTHHLISDDEFDRMRPGAVLINTARGPIVDREALLRALKAGKIAAAALDVTDPEPIDPSDPLLELDNLIVTPHIASASRASRGQMAQMAAQNLIAGLRGEKLPNCVNPEVYG